MLQGSGLWNCLLKGKNSVRRSHMEFKLHRVFYVAKQKESMFQREEQADPEDG